MKQTKIKAPTHVKPAPTRTRNVKRAYGERPNPSTPRQQDIGSRKFIRRRLRYIKALMLNR